MTRYAGELADFPDLLRATAQRRNIPAAIVEKDYFLSRALYALAEGHRGQFILKGGTSLSKGWQLLQRFSEDIDLLARAEADSGKTARHSQLKKFEKTITRTGGLAREGVPDSEAGVHRTVVFTYPSAATDLPALAKTVILEAGYRGNGAASVTRPVQSMVAEFAAAEGHTGLAADLAPFELEVQSLQRTFVEKLFAAHAAYAKDCAANGKARHYYDLYQMCPLPEVIAFIGTEDYRRCVAEVREFSQHTFAGQALPEDDSFANSTAFAPDGDGLRALERNYRSEKTLFFTEQPPLADVLQRIGELLPRL